MNKKNITETGTNTSLVLGVNTNGEIIQFNHTCEQLTGYQRIQVLYKKIEDILIPETYHSQWQETFNTLLHTQKHDSFIIPLLTKNNKEIPVQWSNLPIETKQNRIKNICFIGQIKPTSQSPLTYTIPLKQSESKTDDPSPQKTSPKKEPITQKKSTFCTRKKQKIRLPQLPQIKKSLPQENSYQKQILELEKKYLQLTEHLQQLEKKDRKLERKHKLLEKNIQHLKQHTITLPFHKKNKNSLALNQTTSHIPIQTNSLLQRLRDPLGFKAKKTELYKQLQNLEERKQHLDQIESQLTKKQNILNKKIQDFSTWKEKLIALEKEVERRRSILVEQEKNHGGETHHSHADDVQDYRYDDSSAETKEVQKNKPDPFELIQKIDDSAAILQRGILKKINPHFSELLGFEEKEILDKSLVDFIAPEGLDGIENYYFHRLKGNHSAEYETVFSTKDDRKISVLVSTNPCEFDGEKAIIARFKKNEESEDEE